MIKDFLYSTATRRTISRFVEIFVIAGVVGLLSSPEFQSLLPAGVIGIVAAILKGIREWQDNKK